jgi:hypothetical protein
MTELLIPEWFEEWFDRLFPVEEEPYGPLLVASRLKVNKNVVYRALLSGELEGIKCIGRWVIPRRALKKWLLERYSLNF